MALVPSVSFTQGGGGGGGGGGNSGSGNGGPGGGGGGGLGEILDMGPPPPPPPPRLNINCEVMVDNNISDLRFNGQDGQYITNPNYMDRDERGNLIATSTRFREYFLLTARCNSNYYNQYDNNSQSFLSSQSARAFWVIGGNMPRCRDTANNYNGYCREDYRYSGNPNNYQTTQNYTKVNNSELLIMYKGVTTNPVQGFRDASTIRFRVENDGGSYMNNSRDFQNEWPMSSSLSYSSSPDTRVCRLIVSGAIDPSAPQLPNETVMVAPRTLQFTPVIENATSATQTQIISVEWNGADRNGRLENPPTGQVVPVSARVTVPGKQGQNSTLNCAMQIKVDSGGPRVSLNRYSDCSYFAQLRSYYYLNQTNTAVNQTKYKVLYPGIEAEYSDIPFRGVLNGAAGIKNGEVNIGLNGVVTIPGVADREYSKAVIVAKVLDTKTQTVQSEPIYYGLLDYSDYSSTELMPVPGADPVSPDTTIVFQVYLAGKQQVAQGTTGVVRDMRGQTGGAPYYYFMPASTDGEPFDRIVPMTDESCVPLFQVQTPPITGKVLPARLKSAVTCTYSRPFKHLDLLNGNAAMSVMHFVPEYPTQQFPMEMLRASYQPPCVARNQTQTSCWDIKATALNQNATTPYENHEPCRTVQIVDKDKTICNRYGRNCYTVTVPTPVEIFEASCNVIEAESECGANMAVRFSGYAQMQTAALGCAAKYDRSGEMVSATLRGNGILPYQTFGGSPPSHYTNYGQSIPVVPPANQEVNGTFVRATPTPKPVVTYKAAAATPRPTTKGGTATPVTTKGGIYGGTPTAPPAPTPVPSDPTGADINGNKMGYACIPCRFASDESRLGYNLEDTTQPLPVDQDAPVARKPIFSFAKRSAPAECVRNIEFEVRYFGSGACDGVSNSPGNFCNSGNVPNLSCTTSDTNPNAANRGFVGGGNAAGRFTIPVCPGSGFEFDSISVSWSPVIIDVSGNGISISRKMAEGVMFDLKGTGNKIKVDWPVNSSEVAFLVHPKNGKVESIKELFGDYKAKDGFAAMAKLDTNKDKYLDKKDKKFSELALWLDTNRDGVAQANELRKLEDFGVEKISLVATKLLRKGTEGKTLTSVYFNSKYQRWMNIEDHYFNEYKTIGKRTSR